MMITIIIIIAVIWRLITFAVIKEERGDGTFAWNECLKTKWKLFFFFIPFSFRIFTKLCNESMEGRNGIRISSKYYNHDFCISSRTYFFHQDSCSKCHQVREGQFTDEEYRHADAIFRSAGINY